MSYVVGIDPSLSGTGVVVFRGDGDHDAKRFPSSSRGDKVRERNIRYLSVVSRVIDFIEDCTEDAGEPVAIAIENYAFAAEGRARYSAEFGGILRSDLCAWESTRIYEVAPGTLKKFATGKGDAEKNDVMHAVMDRWECGFSSDDEFDAYVLARIAGCIAGIVKPETARQAECMFTVTKEKFEVYERRVRDPNAILQLPF